MREKHTLGEVGRSGTHSMQEWVVMVRNLAGAGKSGMKK